MLGGIHAPGSWSFWLEKKNHRLRSSPTACNDQPKLSRECSTTVPTLRSAKVLVCFRFCPLSRVADFVGWA